MARKWAKRLKRSFVGVAAGVLIVAAFSAHAENGISAEKIVLGQAAALDGPAAALGQGMREGLLAAFAEATEAGVPFIGAFTGAEFLRTPYKPNVVNVRVSYFQETETMVEHLTKDLGVSRIAIFYQDDAFGQAGLAGVKRALDRRKMALVAEGAYERNTIAV